MYFDTTANANRPVFILGCANIHPAGYVVGLVVHIILQIKHQIQFFEFDHLFVLKSTFVSCLCGLELVTLFLHTNLEGKHSYGRNTCLVIYNTHTLHN